MLDDNLPTFRFKPSTDNPLSSILYFTQNGTDPAAEYLFRRADPALPASRNRYAVALTDPVTPSVIYGEVLVEPEWVQPTLSAAEIRAQQASNAPAPPATATLPGEFTISLYNPDQSVSVKLVPGGFAKSDSWEFELPVQTFRQPSGSEIDKDQAAQPAPDLVPRVMFRWKREGRLSKEMTCYMSGTSLGGRKNKEPDITVAMFKAGRDSALTVYEPNLHRVEVEDRKGLEVVLVLAAEVIKDLWVAPARDVFNISGEGAAARRKNSRPTVTFADAPTVVAAGPTMSGAIGKPADGQKPATTAVMSATPGGGVDAETRRLQAMVEREEREREKREKAEQKRIKKMLDEEEKERRRRDAEVAKETERLRKKYGVEGQELPPLPPRPANSSASAAPPPPQFYPPPPSGYQGPPTQQYYKPPKQSGGLGPGPWGAPPALPPRPLSAGPSGRPSPPSNNGPFHCSTLNTLWNGPGTVAATHIAAHLNALQSPSSKPRKEEERKKVHKKRSSHW
ncbi:hypothetical protein B0T14DRAFT_427167 [Immersiella caudata]|uniref:Uncharacterized protein n=1 Tax=Immersiella caudata TaxID=314043 RepID=A0AA40C351_9PEZI|nr:hypothetical protein B0T14DRAFT_427167 [Immersiella caudata]